MMKKTSILALLLATACSYEFPDATPEPFEPQAGGANFSKYVAIGNSITAGYMDGALYNEGQQSAYPKLVWQAMLSLDAGTVNFLEPLVPGLSEVGYSATLPVVGAVGRLRFDDPSLSPIYDPAIPAQDACSGSSFVPKPMKSDISAESMFAPIGTSPTALGNLGIPGIKVGQLLSKGTGTPGNAEFNPYYFRFASSPGESTPLADILKARGTFFTMLIGANDVLDYAYNGGTKPLTGAGAFATQYQAVVEALMAEGAKGVLINLPDMTETPFFQLVTDQIAKSSFPLDAATAAQLNGAYQLQGFNNVGFQAGTNYLLIETGTGDIRQFRPGKDRICYSLALEGQTGLLGTQPIMVCGQQVGTGKGMGVANFAETVSTPFGPVPKAYPIPNRYVLDEQEIAAAKAQVVAFNQAIMAVHKQYENNTALADFYTAFNQMRNGGYRDASGLVMVNASIAAGGGFSTDGLHPNPKGHAWLANLVIEAINNRFGSNMQTYHLSQFRGNEFPVPTEE